MMAKSLWHLGMDQSILQSKELSDISTSKVLETKYSLISTGTERTVALGNVPEQMYQLMQVPYMEGDFSFPIKYGYSLVGSEKEKSFHCMHPHQDRVKIAEKDLYELSSAIPLHRCTLISNIETVLNGIWDAELKETDSIAICGFGNVGSLLALTLKNYFGKTISVIEKNDWRSQKAESLGLEIDPSGQKNYDVIFHTSATEGGLQYAIDHLNEEGKVIEMSWFGNKKVSLELGMDFHHKRLKIISSQVSKIPKRLRHEMDYLKRKQLAEDILKHNDFDLLIADLVDFNTAPTFFNDLRNNNLKNGLIWIFKY